MKKMKNIFYLLAFISLSSFGAAKDTVNRFVNDVVVRLPNDTSASIPIRRTAILKAYSYDVDAGNIELVWQVKYFTKDSVLFPVVDPYRFIQKFYKDSYLLAGTGNIIANTTDELLSLYGILDANGSYAKTASGNYKLTIPNVIDAYSYFLTQLSLSLFTTVIVNESRNTKNSDPKRKAN